MTIPPIKFPTVEFPTIPKVTIEDVRNEIVQNPRDRTDVQELCRKGRGKFLGIEEAEWMRRIDERLVMLNDLLRMMLEEEARKHGPPTKR
jgi:hypothetical protein